MGPRAAAMPRTQADGIQARGNTSSCIIQLKSPDQEPGLSEPSQPAVVSLRSGRALPHFGRCLRLQRPSHFRAITATGTAAAVAAVPPHWQCPSPAARLFGVTGLSTHGPEPMDLVGPACVCKFLYRRLVHVSLLLTCSKS